MKQTSSMRMLSVVIYAVGILMGLALATMAASADLQSYMFDGDTRDLSDRKLRELQCPVLMTSNEVAQVRVKLVNPNDRPRDYVVRTHITDGFVTLMREYETVTSLQPGDAQAFKWEVVPDDAAWNSYVLVRLYILRSTAMPSRTSSCGIMVLPIPFMSGASIVALMLITSIVLIGIGLYMWYLQSRPMVEKKLNTFYALAALGVVVLSAVAFSLVGLWLVSIPFILGSALFTVSFFSR